MKKNKIFFSFLLFFLCFNMFFCSFSKFPIFKTNAISSENSIMNKEDIVSVNSTEMTSDLKSKCDVTMGQTPFNSSTNSVMAGYSFTPRTATNSDGTTYNEIKNISFTVKPFTFQSGKSVFMWIFFPDDPVENWYSLSLSFKDSSGNSILWSFSPTELSELMSEDLSAYRYGWKLIELPFATGKKSTDATTTYVQFSISYNIILSDIASYLGENTTFDEASYLTNGKLSLYHIFLGNSISSSTKIVLNTNYCYYSLKEDFINGLDDLILKDTYVIKKTNEMFNYLYVGRTNLLLASSQNNRFEFTYTISSKSIINERYPGEKFVFNDEGEYTFSITLKENRWTRDLLQLQKKQTSELVLKLNHPIYIHEYIFGNFNNNFYEIEKDNKYILYFSIKDNFHLTGEIKFSSENEKIFSIENIIYKPESKQYEVTIKAKDSGITSINVSAIGYSDRKPQTQQYESKSTIEVKYAPSGYSDLFQFLITISIASVVLFGVFMFFTIINIKKNKRLQKRQ